MSVITEAKRLGREARGASRSLLVQLALAAAQAAVDGLIDSSDAATIFEAYWGASPQPSTSRKSQASKLRQIIRLADEYPRIALPLLRRVIKLHEAADVPTVQLYEACVIISRRQRERGGRLMNDAEIIDAITRT